MNDEIIQVSEEQLVDAAKEVVKVAREKYLARNGERPQGGGYIGTMQPAGDPVLHDEEQKVIDDAVDGIVERYENMVLPRPRALAGLAEDIRAVSTDFGLEQGEYGDVDLKDLETAAGNMQSWNGAMKEVLVGDYLNPFQMIAANHGRVAEYLGNRAADMGRIYAHRRAKAKEIADKTVSSIEQLSDTDASMFALIMAGLISAGTALTGLAGFLGPAGSVVALQGSALIIGGTMGGQFGPEDSEGEGSSDVDGKEYDLGGKDVPEILEKMWTALDALDKLVAEAEDKVTKDLEKAEDDLLDLASQQNDRKNPSCPSNRASWAPPHRTSATVSGPTSPVVTTTVVVATTAGDAAPITAPMTARRISTVPGRRTHRNNASWHGRVSPGRVFVASMCATRSVRPSVHCGVAMTVVTRPVSRRKAKSPTSRS